MEVQSQDVYLAAGWGEYIFLVPRTPYTYIETQKGAGVYPEAEPLHRQDDLPANGRCISHRGEIFSDQVEPSTMYKAIDTKGNTHIGLVGEFCDGCVSNKGCVLYTTGKVLANMMEY